MKLRHLILLGLAIALVGVTTTARAYICDNTQFFEQCPTTDPKFATIVADFKIRKDGVLINAATVPCTPPISSLPIASYPDELVLLQALRAIYYMDWGDKPNHLPWTNKTLYDWLKEKVGGFEISTTASNDQWGGQLYLGSGDTANYFIIRAKSDSTREYMRKWAPQPLGIANMITLMMHEARHSDAAFNHVRCCPAQDPASPNSACDQTYEETINLSPYGIQYWLEKNWITGKINVGLGCMTTADKAIAVGVMRMDANIHLAGWSPTSNNFCTNSPPILTDANNPPDNSCTCTGISGSSSGEPHLKTLDGLYYDFQAAGEFLLIENGPSFIVQVRQQWTPNRPNVAFNKAVAMRMGKVRVGVFVDPARVVVDGKQVTLADGSTLSLPDNVEISRTGNVFAIKRDGGETVQVTVVDSEWVDILGGHFLDTSVSLNYTAYGGMCGLLGNGDRDVNDDIATRDGKVFAQPISFGDFYHRYGASLSIKPNESLFGEDRRPHRGVAFEAPRKLYTVKNLTPEEYEFGHAACVNAGVKSEPLLDACTLDVAVLRSRRVAKLYSGAPAPVAVMAPGTGIHIISGIKNDGGDTSR